MRLERSVEASSMCSILETSFKASKMSIKRTSSSPTEKIACSSSNSIVDNSDFNSLSSKNVSNRTGNAASNPSLIRTLLINT